MKKYFITFQTGTSDIVKRVLTESRITVEEISDGIAVISTSKSPKELEAFGFINHVYLLISKTVFKGSIEKTVSSVSVRGFEIPPSFFKGRNFKVRVSYIGQTVSFNRKALAELEGHIARNYKLKLDTEGKCNEFWFYMRENRNVYFGLKLTDTKSKDVDRKKGQLKSSIGSIMVSMAKLGSTSVILDPFCGSGGISDEILKAPFKKLIINDINDEAVRLLKKKYAGNQKVIIHRGDYASIQISKGTVDIIITDPPWGEFEQGIDFKEMAYVFQMWLKPKGKLIVLVSNNLHEELVYTFEMLGFEVSNIFGTLIGGNKAKIIEAYKV